MPVIVLSWSVNVGEVAMGDHQLAIGHLRLGQRVPLGDLHRVVGHGRSATVGA